MRVRGDLIRGIGFVVSVVLLVTAAPSVAKAAGRGHYCGTTTNVDRSPYGGTSRPSKTEKWLGKVFGTTQVDTVYVSRGRVSCRFAVKLIHSLIGSTAWSPSAYWNCDIGSSARNGSLDWHCSNGQSRVRSYWKLYRTGPPTIDDPAILVLQGSNLDLPQVTVELRASRFCSAGLTKAATVIVRDGMQTARTVLQAGTPCSSGSFSWTPAQLSTPFNLEASPSGSVESQSPTDPAVDLTFGDFTHYLEVQVFETSRLVEQETFTFSAVGADVVYVWQGTDNFVNFCIDQDQPIYSKNGRLYCTEDVGGGYWELDNLW